jgi:murein DD-endopeptidase MepM/ murein hydrolase activator NlpD
MLLGLSYVWYRGNTQTQMQMQIKELELQAKTLQFKLEAEQARSDTYSVEAVQMQQDLKVLESELNRLRVKVKLPPVRLVPNIPKSQPQQQPKADPSNPRGAGEPVDLGDLLLSLRSQMGNFSTELELVADTIATPLTDPRPQRRRLSGGLQKPGIALSDLRALPPLRSTVGELPPSYDSFIPSGVPLLSETRVTSNFGYRGNPFNGRGAEFHNGIDFAAPMGTPVYATASGMVSEVGWNRIFGLMVMVDHGNGYHTLYGHLSRTYVERGQRVGQAAPLGEVGSTGRSTGPHLHYTVFRYGSSIDPAPFVSQ